MKRIEGKKKEQKRTEQRRCQECDSSVARTEHKEQ